MPAGVLVPNPAGLTVLAPNPVGVAVLVPKPVGVAVLVPKPVGVAVPEPKPLGVAVLAPNPVGVDVVAVPNPAGVAVPAIGEPNLKPDVGVEAEVVGVPPNLKPPPAADVMLGVVDAGAAVLALVPGFGVAHAGQTNTSAPLLT